MGLISLGSSVRVWSVFLLCGVFYRTFDHAFGESVEICLDSVALVYIGTECSSVLQFVTDRLAAAAPLTIFDEASNSRNKTEVSRGRSLCGRSKHLKTFKWSCRFVL